ncbi:MAG: hypothetical protein ACI9X4_001706, partial [Glaciecola sp.]
GVRAASRQGQPTERRANGRTLLLQALLSIRDIRLGGDFKRQLWDWEKLYPSDSLALLSLLAKGGDAKAKRQYLEKHNTRIKNLRKAGGRQFASALLARGSAYQRVADYRSAQRDAEKGLKVLDDIGETGGVVTKNLRILAARASAAGGRFRAAADFLEEAMLNSKEAAKLFQDPDFLEFVVSRYGEILQP